MKNKLFGGLLVLFLITLFVMYICLPGLWAVYWRIGLGILAFLGVVFIFTVFSSRRGRGGRRRERGFERLPRSHESHMHGGPQFHEPHMHGGRPHRPR